MTTTTRPRPVPPHGSYARANGSPGYRPACKCEPCMTVRRRRDKRNKVNRALGRSSFTDPARAQAHLQLLHTRLSWSTIHAATRIPQSALIDIYKGRRKKIFKTTESKILALSLTRSADPGRFVDATGSIRRVRAMQRVGHSRRAIAAAASSHPNRITSLALGRQPTIRAQLADRIAQAYTRLAFNPPALTKHTARTINMSRAAGWHSPLAWDDIDNPAAQPAADVPDRELGRDELAALRRDEIWLLKTAVVPSEQIAKRLDMGLSTVKAIRAELNTGRRTDRRKKQEAGA